MPLKKLNLHRHFSRFRKIFVYEDLILLPCVSLMLFKLPNRKNVFNNSFHNDKVIKSYAVTNMVKSSTVGRSSALHGNLDKNLPHLTCKHGRYPY
jgi:hypothetical protein